MMANDSCARFVSFLSRNDPLVGESFFVRPLIFSIYLCVLSFGAMGNVLVMAAVIRNPALRGPRNFFIVNLALSDFLLCTVTVPSTIYMNLYMYWDLGAVTCRLVSSAQCVNIFVSTLSITAIGLDRYIVIIFPTKSIHMRSAITILFISVWLLSLTLALPYFFATRIEFTLRLLGKVMPPEQVAEMLHEFYNVCNFTDERYMTCTESDALWDSLPIGKRSFTVSCFLFQYLLPLCAMIFVYCRISIRMQNRMVTGPQYASRNRRRSVAERQTRTNLLLVALVMIFAISWLPSNVYATLISFNVVKKFSTVVFCCCHIVAMTSACANPVLYGAFNENFRNEFVNILEKLGILQAVRRLHRCLRPQTVVATEEPGDINTLRSNLNKEAVSTCVQLPAVTCPPSTYELTETSPLKQASVWKNGVTNYRTETHCEQGETDVFLKQDPN